RARMAHPMERRSRRRCIIARRSTGSPQWSAFRSRTTTPVQQIGTEACSGRETDLLSKVGESLLTFVRHRWQRNFEAFSVYRNCKRSNIFVLAQQNPQSGDHVDRTAPHEGDVHFTPESRHVRCSNYVYSGYISTSIGARWRRFKVRLA